ncbi:MAG: hypothetical protein WC007_12420 [Pelobacteraceae bacterium]
MAERSTKTLILLGSLFLSVATSPCHSQEPGKLFDVKTPQKEVAPVLVPETANTAGPRATQAKPDKEVSDKSWFWRLIEGTAIGAAKYNTERQSEGRPPVNSYKAWP